MGRSKKFDAKAATMKWLKNAGWDVVFSVEERRGPVTHDLFGCLDIMAIKKGRFLGVQATTKKNAAAHVRKIEAATNDLLPWWDVGGMVELWIWPDKAKPDAEPTIKGFDPKRGEWGS